MSIGLRIREERTRLGFNQTAFGELAGVRKGTQMSWEKDASSPPASALVAFAEAGADVLYILTGVRHTVSADERTSWGAQDMLDRAERLILNQDEEANRGGYSREKVLSMAHHTLTSIATSEFEEVTEASKERADDLLRQYFDDDAAAKRRSARFASIMTRRERAAGELADAIAGMSLELPRGLHHQILMLAQDYQIPIRDVLPLLSELRTFKSENR